MQKMIVLFFLITLSLSAMGQDEPMAPKQAMERLAFLSGKWSGSGWQMGPDRQRHTFQQTEHIDFAAGGEVLVIRGLGKSPDPESGEPRVIHDAVALVSYDPSNDRYDFRSYAAGRGGGNYEGQWVEDHHFEWFMDTPQGKIRYTITLNDAGQWHETGEIQMGEQWFQFFEMTLDRKK